jgi:hypothetical protein
VRDYWADLLLPQSYSSLPTAGVRLMPPAEGMRSENDPHPSDVLMYGTHSPFNEQGLPTNGWGSTSTTLWANTGYMLSRLSLGLDTDTRANWTFQMVSDVYNSNAVLDSDKDGIDDGLEYSGNNNTRPPTDPLNPDSDGDGLEDDYELAHGLDPNNGDSDGDGTEDGSEINPDTGNTYLEDQLAEGLTVATEASNPGWTMGQSIGSNGYVRFTIDDIDGIGIWATIREGGAEPEAFTSTVTNAVVAYSNSSFVSGFRTLSLLLVQDDTNSPVVVTIGDGGTYWTNQTPQNIGPDISARFQAVRVAMDDGDSYYYINSEYAYAYISGIPEMPEFFAYLTPENKIEGNVSWRCRIEYIRDALSHMQYYPSNSWRNMPAMKMWNMGDEIGVEFRGGTASIYCQLGGKIFTNSMYVRGLNPEDSVAKGYIQSIDGVHWYAWAIGWHETILGGDAFNQFNEAGTYANQPNRSSDTTGWGLFQIDSSSGVQIDPDILWNWKHNAVVAIWLLDEFRIEAQSYFNAVQRTYTNEYESPPDIYVPPNTSTALTALDAANIQLYNGAAVRTNLVNPYGGISLYRSCWKFYPTNTSGSRWEFTPNENDYVRKVIQDYENNN